MSNTNSKMFTRQGVFDKVPTQDIQVRETDLVLPNNHLQSTDAHQAKLAHVKDTHAFLSSINPTRFGEEYAMLLGFPDGTPITVTYFHRNESQFNIRTIGGEIDKLEHAVHKDLTQINDFEIRLVSPIDHMTIDETDEFELTFTAVTYPGFTPIAGDVFFMNLGDSKIGECRVSEVERTTHRHGMFHRIHVYVVGYLDSNSLNEYRSRVFDTVHFEKTIYFNSGFSFMRHDSYVSLQDLQKKRREIIQWYFNKYYVDEAKTLMRLDGIYDPYVVKFLWRIVSMEDSGKRPVQLYPRVPDYNRTIWYMLSESEYIDFDTLISTIEVPRNTRGLFNTDINYLLNRRFIQMKSSGGKGPYVMSDQFYVQGSDMTNFEQLIYDAKVSKIINPKKVIDQLENYKRLDDELGFYHLPLYIWLIDVAIRSLTNPVD